MGLMSYNIEEKIAGPQFKIPDVHVNRNSTTITSTSHPELFQLLRPGLYRLDWDYVSPVASTGRGDRIVPYYQSQADTENAVSGEAYGQVKKYFTVKDKESMNLASLNKLTFYSGKTTSAADYKNIVLTMIEQTEEII